MDVHLSPHCRCKGKNNIWWIVYVAILTGVVPLVNVCVAGTILQLIKIRVRSHNEDCGGKRNLHWIYATYYYKQKNTHKYKYATISLFWQIYTHFLWLLKCSYQTLVKQICTWGRIFYSFNNKSYCLKWHQGTETVYFTGNYKIINYPRHLRMHFNLSKSKKRV